MQTTVVSLKDRTDVFTLNVNEEFWLMVHFIAFYDQLIEIRMKTGVSHNFFRYWAYKIIQGNDHTDKEKQEIYRHEKCDYRFLEDSDEFIDWLYTESKKRDLVLF